MKTLNCTTFNLNEYNGIGFDLDNTLIRYNVPELLRLQYEILARFLVEERGYPSKLLPLSLGQEHLHLMRKGLILDLPKGNLLLMRSDGKILESSHGTRLLSQEQIGQIYESHHATEATFQMAQDLLSTTYNGPIPSQYRLLQDFFDVPAGLVFALAVDAVDNTSTSLDDYLTNLKNKTSKYSNIWQDIVAAFHLMFDHCNYRLNKGDFYPAIKNKPEKYLIKASKEFLNLLKEMKSSRKMFLLTGSPADFATFIADYVLGENWKNYFDIIIVNARKPGFFLEERPFFQVHDFIETTKYVPAMDLVTGQYYSQGNWKELKSWLNVDRVVYFGDNLIQDIRAPPMVGLHSVAVIDEIEKGLDLKPFWKHKTVLSPELLYTSAIELFARICIPNLEVLPFLHSEKKTSIDIL